MCSKCARHLKTASSMGKVPPGIADRLDTSYETSNLLKCAATIQFTNVLSNTRFRNDAAVCPSAQPPRLMNEESGVPLKQPST